MDQPHDSDGTPGIEARIARLEAAAARSEPASPGPAERALRMVPVFAVSNLLLAAPAFVISIAVAYFTFVQAEATEKMQVATVWPHVAYETSNIGDDGEPVIRLSLKNQGVGPAKIDGLEIRYQGKPYREARAFLADCCADDPASLRLGLGSVNGSVLRPGESADFLVVTPEGLTPEVWTRFNSERFRLGVKLCYCSVFDDCWVAEQNSMNPQPVAECPAQWVQFGIPQQGGAPE